MSYVPSFVDDRSQSALARRSGTGVGCACFIGDDVCVNPLSLCVHVPLSTSEEHVLHSHLFSSFHSGSFTSIKLKDRLDLPQGTSGLSIHRAAAKKGHQLAKCGRQNVDANLSVSPIFCQVSIKLPLQCRNEWLTHSFSPGDYFGSIDTLSHSLNGRYVSSRQIQIKPEITRTCIRSNVR
ncbi:hypothetical protein TNCV_2948361 [Trichonephila clavipes]|nr:hypothetical protein TNCV_2948361 [Trichonephila clavipes]